MPTESPAIKVAARDPETPRGIPAVLRFLGLAILGVVLLLFTCWAAAALYFDVRTPWARLPLAIGYPLGILILWISCRDLWLNSSLTVGAFMFVLAWWLGLKPSNTRDWQPDLATLPFAEIEGSKVTVHNVRNCDYRTETDFDVRHYDKTYDIEQLRSADLYMVYWGSPYMAHTMISFGFEGGDYLCFSIECRKERGESYSAVRGLFRQFELAYIVADERDVVRLRTNYRQGEDAYLYRLNYSRDKVRASFLEYISRINSLRQQPEWYSALTQNCTTSIRAQRAATDRMPWDWRLLVNGYGDTLLYDRGVIATKLPFAELKQRCHINPRAKAADDAKDFSGRIRQGIPGIEL